MSTKSMRDDFEREVKTISSFDHENILRLIGVVIVDNRAPSMVFEYMQYGDFAALLQSNDPCSGVTPKIELTQSDQIDMAAQVACGMKYLASKHFVHSDLATRNCLVGEALIVKIADFGMSRDVYVSDYYKLDNGSNCLFPLRWMSLETVRYGRYTTESDVWAFGVLLWEIFANAKQPYYGHSNEEVIQFLEDGILLQKPAGCPDDVYHVMLGCWRRDPRQRFAFERVHRHLRELADGGGGVVTTSTAAADHQPAAAATSGAATRRLTIPSEATHDDYDDDENRRIHDDGDCAQQQQDQPQTDYSTIDFTLDAN